MSYTVTLYNNQYQFPHYSRSLSGGTSFASKPHGTGVPNGSINVQISKSQLETYNYIRVGNDYGWITGYVNSGNDSLFTVSYRVDPLRTYWNKITFGNQYMVRSPKVTAKHDNLLGDDTPYGVVYSERMTFPQSDYRFLVIQSIPYSGDSDSDNPVQPSQYDYHAIRYEPKNPKGTYALNRFMFALEQLGDTITNIITAYSVPYLDLASGWVSSDLVVRSTDYDITVEDCYRIPSIGADSIDYYNLLLIDLPDDDFFRRGGTMSIVIPDAGVISIPLENFSDTDGSGVIYLRQDVDIYSGASNYSIVNDGNDLYDISARGSSLSSIPIISNPLDTYLSQNQNTLAVSMLGDVANVAVGGAMIAGGNLAGAGLVAGGLGSMVSRNEKLKSMESQHGNPSAYLGSALTYDYNQTVFVVTRYIDSDNDDIVHTDKGYPQEKYDSLEPNTTGYYETSNCMVRGNNVPSWAINEINGLFNSGIRIY